MSHALQDLVGSWEADMGDRTTRMKVGKVRLEFYCDHTLAYVIFEQGKMQIIKLTYSIVGNKLVTDQPSHPSVHETEFELSGRLLKLFYDSEPVVFKKLS